MERRLTNEELEYLESLLSRIEKFRSGLKGSTIDDEIEILKGVYNRKSINTDVKFSGNLGRLYGGVTDLINSWKQWYMSTTALLKNNNKIEITVPGEFINPHRKVQSWTHGSDR